MESKKYKYMKQDFTELPVTLSHLDIYLNFVGDFVEATNTLYMMARQELSQLVLDAKDLEISNVSQLIGNEFVQLNYDYEKDHSKLVIRLNANALPGEKLVLKTATRCTPSDNILEGIYKDVTPPGAPQQYMSQCQQWGFQRIMPIFDDCRAKCTMRTTLEADARYTHMISNGNISKETNPDGKPVLKPGDHSRQLITFENSTPMAPYLFIAAVGTWDELVDHVTYPSGKSVRLEYLVPPGRTKDAVIPMEILKKSVLWVGETQDYEYTGDTYRTICMTKSNFGGMENVGNTTIVTDAALIDEHTLDQSIMYAHAVIVHEFEHNQCGSETTMDTPFDVWLNEAYTVDVERAFIADQFDPDFIRLSQVDSIRSPLLGPLAIEDGGAAGKIVREGFNDPDDLIDGVTYVKAAEVIRMLRLVIGPENFLKGKALYFQKYKHGNADTDQFFACFEEVSGMDLSQFKREWLYRIGYPEVTAVTHIDAANNSCKLNLRQSLEPGSGPFHIPMEIALIDQQGNEISGTNKIIEITQEEQEFSFADLPVEPAFASLNRNYSFYGTFASSDADIQLLKLQARLDTNAFNRVEAMRRLTDRQRVGRLLDVGFQVEDEWLDIYGTCLHDSTMSPGLKAYFLRIEEQPYDRTYFNWFPELAETREFLMKTVANKFYTDLKKAFTEIDTYKKSDDPKVGIEERILKNLILDLLSSKDNPEIHDLILDHYTRATSIQDKVSALAILNRTTYPKRIELLTEAYEHWHRHISGYANYLRIVGTGTNDDVYERLDFEKNRHTFDIMNPTWSRALFMSMAVNNKMLWKPEGLAWITQSIIDLSKINGYVAGKLLNAFQAYRNMKPELQAKVKPCLEKIIQEISTSVSPTIHGQAAAYYGAEQS